MRKFFDAEVVARELKAQCDGLPEQLKNL